MSRKTVFATTAGTVACALAIGFFMQRGAGTPAKVEELAPVEVAQAELAPVIPDIGPDPYEAVGLDLAEIKLTSANALPSVGHVKDLLFTTKAVFEPVSKDFVAPRDPAMPRLGCDVAATASPAPMASVTLTLDAPCNASQRVTIHHTGMMFTQTTSDSGQLKATVPALSENAVFIIEFDNGKGAVAMVRVPDLKDFDRVALQWAGDNGFQIHAREFGAAYGSAGHIWSGSELPSASKSFVTRLGDTATLNPNVAEIYTFPLAGAPHGGDVALTVEAEVTAGNCGRDIAAQSIELRGSGRPRTQDLILSVPDCSAVGDFLVLNNLVDDLKIAAN